MLAHQGGWDEALLAGLPIAVFAGLVWNAKRRARQADAEPAEHADTEPDS